MKKALIFIEDGSFSYDNRVIREANALVNAGWGVTVISPKYPDDPVYKKISKNLRAYFYAKPTMESILGHVIEGFCSLFFGTFLTFWVFVRHGFSVFHACNPMDLLWVIALPYKLLGKKFIFDQHDLVPELMQSRGFKNPKSKIFKTLVWLEKNSYRLADTVIATNESYKETAIERGRKKPEDVFVVRNGPDLDNFKIVPPKKGLKNKAEILVGYLGNMNPQDGTEYLLKAAEEIIKKWGIANIKFVFVGGGSSQPDLHEESLNMGLESHVKFTGRIPDDEMLSVLSACDICVQPDPFNPLNDKSTMNKVLEYMALEKPVIAFDLKETRVSCGDAALYAKTNDVIDLADKIIYLTNNPELRSHMMKVGRERVEKKLAWDYSVPYLLGAYKHVLPLREIKNSPNLL